MIFSLQLKLWDWYQMMHSSQQMQWGYISAFYIQELWVHLKMHKRKYRKTRDLVKMNHFLQNNNYFESLENVFWQVSRSALETNLAQFCQHTYGWSRKIILENTALQIVNMTLVYWCHFFHMETGGRKASE